MTPQYSWPRVFLGRKPVEALGQHGALGEKLVREEATGRQQNMIAQAPFWAKGTQDCMNITIGK